MNAQPKVLVIEEDNEERARICRIIEGSNLFIPIEAVDTFDAFKLLKKARSGLGFLGYKIDCMIMGSSCKSKGFEFLKAFRNEESLNFLYYRMPVIVLTASSNKNRNNPSKNSVLAFAAIKLMTPFAKEDLINLLRRLIIDQDNEILLDILKEKV